MLAAGGSVAVPVSVGEGPRQVCVSALGGGMCPVRSTLVTQRGLRSDPSTLPQSLVL